MIAYLNHYLSLADWKWLKGGFQWPRQVTGGSATWGRLRGWEHRWNAELGTGNAERLCGMGNSPACEKSIGRWYSLRMVSRAQVRYVVRQANDFPMSGRQIRFFILFSVVPLLAGTLVYLGRRSDSLLGFRWIELIEMTDLVARLRESTLAWPLPPWVRYSLPDGFRFRRHQPHRRSVGGKQASRSSLVAVRSAEIRPSHRRRPAYQPSFRHVFCRGYYCLCNRRYACRSAMQPELQETKV